jgi:hypothetical protein
MIDKVDFIMPAELPTCFYSIKIPKFKINLVELVSPVPDLTRHRPAHPLFKIFLKRVAKVQPFSK